MFLGSNQEVGVHFQKLCIEMSRLLLELSFGNSQKHSLNSVSPKIKKVARYYTFRVGVKSRADFHFLKGGVEKFLVGCKRYH